MMLNIRDLYSRVLVFTVQDELKIDLLKNTRLQFDDTTLFHDKKSFNSEDYSK